MVWIHPFGNGNGRTARLLTYAMIIRLFDVRQSRLFNPTAIFCADRNRYYEMLKMADSGNNDGILRWCEFVLKGLLNELKKTEKFADKEFVQTNILYPILQDAHQSGSISDEIEKALSVPVQKPVFQSGDLANIWPDSFNRSRNVRKLLNARLIKPINEGARKYVLNFSTGPLMRSLISVFFKQGILPESLLKNEP